uniref:Uncharacterized protein n=1 Tax=Steinernema glaseri TaxID=37863 RepID=A0A1I8AWI4_9BILA
MLEQGGGGGGRNGEGGLLHGVEAPKYRYETLRQYAITNPTHTERVQTAEIAYTPEEEQRRAFGEESRTLSSTTVLRTEESDGGLLGGDKLPLEFGKLLATLLRPGNAERLFFVVVEVGRVAGSTTSREERGLNLNGTRHEHRLPRSCLLRSCIAYPCGDP